MSSVEKMSTGQGTREFFAPSTNHDLALPFNSKRGHAAKTPKPWPVDGAAVAWSFFVGAGKVEDMSKDKAEVYEVTNGHCAYCGVKLDVDYTTWHMDHIIPRSQGGRWKGNLIAACPTCNLRKNANNPEEFRKHLKARALKNLKAALIEELERLVPFVDGENQLAILRTANTLLAEIDRAEIHFYMDDLENL